MEKVNILLMVDFFSRQFKYKILHARKRRGIKQELTEIFAKNFPEKLIADNATEFCSREFKNWCTSRDITHHIISIENRRSSRRIERIIRSIIDQLIKNQNGTLEERLLNIVNAYNATYHRSMKCALNEAYQDINGKA
ncbi:hypothetical protein COBT_001599 [Conglomerata obtusa]